MKHNKKRNTAFLYESLIKELTKSVVRKQPNKKKKIIEIIKKYFYKNSTLKRDLECYTTLLEVKTTDENYVLRLMTEVKSDYKNLDRKSIFNNQTQLIKEMNATLSNEAFANFISNYKSLATVGQYLNSDSVGAKSRLVLESRVGNIIKQTITSKEDMRHIDNLTYKKFVDRFNETYEKTLRTEQKRLLTNYITSFSDNGLQLKVFMNEEIGRLKGCVGDKLKLLNSNDSNYHNFNKVMEKLDKFSNNQIDESMVKTLFYIQDLVNEVDKNGN